MEMGSRTTSLDSWGPLQLIYFSPVARTLGVLRAQTLLFREDCDWTCGQDFGKSSGETFWEWWGPQKDWVQNMGWSWVGRNSPPWPRLRSYEELKAGWSWVKDHLGEDAGPSLESRGGISAREEWAQISLGAQGALGSMWSLRGYSSMLPVAIKCSSETKWGSSDTFTPMLTSVVCMLGLYQQA